jgi:copper oxidase (laccase) domain-containing protein
MGATAEQLAADARRAEDAGQLVSAHSLYLRAAGVGEVRLAGLCTRDDPARFFSARRDRPTGRQAGIIVVR